MVLIKSVQTHTKSVQALVKLYLTSCPDKLKCGHEAVQTCLYYVQTETSTLMHASVSTWNTVSAWVSQSQPGSIPRRGWQDISGNTQ